MLKKKTGAEVVNSERIVEKMAETMRSGHLRSLHFDDVPGKKLNDRGKDDGNAILSMPWAETLG
jgi:hypothetical protein